MSEHPGNEGGVIINALYKHYKGSLYRVITTCFREDDRALLVVYQQIPAAGAEPGPIWSRPLSEFTDRVEGRPRYELWK